MDHDDKTTDHRRRELVKLVGTTALLAPFAGLSACSGEKEPASTAAPAASEPAQSPAAEPAAMAEEAAAQPAAAETAPSAAAELPKLSVDDPQARSLGYVEDATETDAAKYPRYEAGQVCANCALYSGGEGADYGPCSIFPGRLVNANGWCSVYAPKG